MCSRRRYNRGKVVDFDVYDVDVYMRVSNQRGANGRKSIGKSSRSGQQRSSDRRSGQQRAGQADDGHSHSRTKRHSDQSRAKATVSGKRSTKSSRQPVAGAPQRGRPQENLDPSTQKVSWVTVDDSRADQRIDNFLVARFKGVPKSHFYRILRKGEIRVNKSRVKPEYRLKEGDLIRVPPLRVSASKPDVQLSQSLAHYLSSNILYEDDGLMVVNKPAGLAVHGGSQVAFGLIEALRSLRKDCRFLELVHRLDRDTSGCIMVAKKRSVLRFLQACLREKGGIDKTYCALVAGFWPNHVTQVDAPLLKGEERDGGRIVRVRPDGKPSQTVFRVLERFSSASISSGGLGEVTLVEAKPMTGRTHQIRVHAQWMKMPLLGDEKYGVDTLNHALSELGGRRLFLHAKRLEIPVYSGGDSVESGAASINNKQECRSNKQECRNNEQERISNKQKRATLVVEAPLAPDLDAVLKHLR